MTLSKFKADVYGTKNYRAVFLVPTKQPKKHECRQQDQRKCKFRRVTFYGFEIQIFGGSSQLKLTQLK
jgi:hypothetical protein